MSRNGNKCHEHCRFCVAKYQIIALSSPFKRCVWRPYALVVTNLHANCNKLCDEIGDGNFVSGGECLLTVAVNLVGSVSSYRIKG